MQDFQKLYETWSDTQLIEAFRKPEDYQPAAWNAIRRILQNRGLLAAEEASARQVEAQRALDSIAEQRQAQQRYEEKMLGTSMDDARFAAQALQADGTYLTFAVSLRKRQPMMYIPLTIAILCFVTCFLPVRMREFPIEYRLIAACGGLVAGALTAVAFVSSRMEMRLQANGKGGHQLAWGSDGTQKTLDLPAKYAFGATWKPVGNGISFPQLLAHFVDAEGRSVVIEELLTALQSCPPNWPLAPGIGTIPKDAVVMTVLSGKRPVLVRLKKILDGLHSGQA